MSSSKEDPPDVIFRGASFEIKEILDPRRQRHREYKEALNSALKTDNPKDLLTKYSPINLTPDQVGDLLLTKLDHLKNRYSQAVKADLDILFYVNLKDHNPTEGPMPSSSIFSGFGWRSVSAVFSLGGFVFYARDDSPDFLFSRNGTKTISGSS